MKWLDLSFLYFWIADFIRCSFQCTFWYLRFVFRVWLEQKVIEVLLGIPVQRWASKMSPEHKNGDSNFLFLNLNFFKNPFRVNLDQVVNQDLLWVSVVFVLISHFAKKSMIAHIDYIGIIFVMINLRLPLPVEPTKPLTLMENAPMSLFWPLMNKNSLLPFW